MSNPDDPFAPSDATILRPRPGAGRRPGVPPAGPAAPPPPPPLPPYVPPPDPPSGGRGPLPAVVPELTGARLNPLVQAALPLLALAGRLRGQVAQADPEGLRRQIVQEVQAFEERARRMGVASEDVLAGRYALCAAIDEAVLNTPWGAQSGWASQSLLVTFHREAFGGEKFFQILERIASEPARYIDLLELLYVCIALGFEGKYRLEERGAARLAEIRQDLYRRIQAQRGTSEPELSAHWKGVEDRRNAVARVVPVWVVAAVCACVLVGTFLFLNSRLDARAAPASAALANIGLKDVMAALPPPDTGASSSDVARLLAPEIAQGLVKVDENSRSTVIRITAGDLFASGTASLNPQAEPLVRAIAKALEQVPGAIKVFGHTDSQPLRSLEYRDNYALSLARANHVMKLMGRDISNAARLQAIGAGSDKPLYTPPDDPANQKRNRRVEIVLMRDRSG